MEPRGKTQYTGNIVLLTSANSISAAEVFALTLRSFPTVTLLGEESAGAFSDVLIKSTASGIEFGLSNEIYLSVEGISYEGRGVPVAIQQTFATKEEREKLIDLGLEKAEKFLLAH